MEHESWRLEHQRECYLEAARTAKDKRLALRRLLAVERLTEEIDSLRDALASLDDVTQPITVTDEPEDHHPTLPGLGPIVPPAF